jgi:hypothetical protein
MKRDRGKEPPEREREREKAERDHREWQREIKKKK